MEYRRLGKTDYKISALSLGTWQVGGRWGSKFDPANADRIINTAIDEGINFIDTADVYGDGMSEKAVGRVVRQHQGKIYVATKCGRRLQPHIDKNYTLAALRRCIEDSLKNMGLDCIDLIQLHCPPWKTYYRSEVFELFDRLQNEGKINALGVSVEKVEQGIKVLQYPNVSTVQIIYNMFRQRPEELFFDLAKKHDVGIIVRVPLASGLLTGTYTKSTTFTKDDHRTFNRTGEAFDRGETFSGVEYEIGLMAAEELKEYFIPRDLAHVALQWTLHNDAVSCVIPGASRPEQLMHNLHALQLPALTSEDLAYVEKIYGKYIKASVHQEW